MDSALLDRLAIVYGQNRSVPLAGAAGGGSRNATHRIGGGNATAVELWLQALAGGLRANNRSGSSSNSGINNSTSEEDSAEAAAAAISVLFQPRYGLAHIVATSIVLGIIILCTIIGNVFVVAAIILEKNLQSVSNYLILSLAVADLMVATLVMPISALNELSKAWWLGIHLCDLWICFDILCCTASILHLVGIAVDRYWAVTNVDYIRVRTAKRIGCIIAAVWIVSMVISVPARFSLSDYDRRTQIANGTCAINEEKAYTIFSTVGAFYLPMFFMMAIYAKIYQTARKRIRKKAFKAPKKALAMEMQLRQQQQQQQQQQDGAAGASQVDENDEDHLEEEAANAVQTTSFGPPAKRGRHGDNHNNNSSNNNSNSRAATAAAKQPERRQLTPQSKAAHQREKVEQKRERKAARTLAIITGCFLICWIPFFLRALVCPFQVDLCTSLIPDYGNSFILWLGYMNSLLNPVIYTIFSPDFRNAFSKILFGRYHRRGYR